MTRPGLALAIADAVDRGRSDAAELAQGRRAPVRATRAASTEETREAARLRAIVEMSAWCAMEDDE